METFKSPNFATPAFVKNTFALLKILNEFVLSSLYARYLIHEDFLIPSQFVLKLSIFMIIKNIFYSFYAQQFFDINLRHQQITLLYFNKL